MIYSFLDPIIFLAYRIPHLSLDQLPPLSDYDRAKHLVTRSFKVMHSLHFCAQSQCPDRVFLKHLDPFLVGKKQHLFFGLMSTFRA